MGRRRNLSTLAVGALAIALGGLAIPLAANAGAATKPHIVVTPVSGLTNGKSVKVSGTGFKPGDNVYIVECLFVAKDSTGCNILNTVAATITPKGVLKTSYLKLATGKIGNGYCGTKKANLKSCAVSVGNAQGTDSAVARIQFKLPKG